MDLVQHDVPRAIATLAEEYLSGLRVLILNGARQSGKTTLMQQIQGAVGGELRSLDDDDTLTAALADPAGFVTADERPLMIDEVQRGGDRVVLAVKSQVDRSREAGQYVLAGSTRFLTAPTLTESLAGRAGVLEVWPFSQGELEGRREHFVDLLFTDHTRLSRLKPPGIDRMEYLERVVRGGYPELQHINSARARDSWFRSYVASVTERDVREMARVREASAANLLLRALAATTAQELVTQTLSSRTDLSRATVDRYVHLLESVFMIHQLRPWSRNGLNRAIRRAKVHVVDSGLAAHLMGMTSASLARPTQRETGQLVETFGVNEIAKQASWADAQVRLHHYRHRDGAEVDLVLENARGQVVAIEIKAAMGANAGDFKHLRKVQQTVGDDFLHGIVLHLGERVLPFGDRMTALPLGCLWRH